MFDHNAFVASQGPNLDPPDVEDHECERDRCPHCGNCHVVLNQCFTPACAAYVTTCMRCLKTIDAGASKEVSTYPLPGWFHQACYEAEIAELVADQQAEMEAERRNEEALYGYELER
jgi:hypothetical protein